MALQVCAVLVRRHLPRPAAVLPPGRRVDVLPRRRPRVVVVVVVLGAERLEHELRRLEPPRDVEVARDELIHTTDRRTFAQAEPGERIVACPSDRECTPKVRRSRWGREYYSATPVSNREQV